MYILYDMCILLNIHLSFISGKSVRFTFSKVTYSIKIINNLNSVQYEENLYLLPVNTDGM